MKSRILFGTLFIALATLGLMIACGGGGGDGTTTTSSGETGSVAVLVTDAPAGADEIWITITEVTLIPPEYAGNRKPYVIYSSAEGHTIDLLEYQDSYYMLKLATGVPAGKYEKIRLRIKDIKTEGSEECDELDLKLPNGRIDVNPRGTFEVVGGKTLQIKLDMDAEKSINLHRAGRSGKCIFRPVVFADIEFADDAPRECPEILSGTIVTVFTEEYTDEDDSDDDRIGFSLQLNDKRGSLEVIIDDDAVVYDGRFLDRESWWEALQEAANNETKVKVRGRLKGDRLVASVVVIGEILDLKGYVSAVGTENGDFIVDLDADQELVPSVDVILDEQGNTVVLSGCDQPFEPSEIEVGMRVRVFGKYDTSEELLRAVAILVKFPPVEGRLSSMISKDDGYEISVLAGDGDDSQAFFLPPTASVFVGGAQIKFGAWDALAELVNCRMESDLLNAVLKTEPDGLTVKTMKIAAESVEGVVRSVDQYNREIHLTDGTLIKLVDDPILQKNSSSTDLDDLEKDDEVTAFGLKACEEDAVDFYAYIVLASDDDDDEDDGDDDF